MMTVGKLIEILQKAPKDMRVGMLVGFENGCYLSFIESVGYKKVCRWNKLHQKFITNTDLMIGKEMTEGDFAEEDLLWGKHLEESKRERLAELTRTVLPENEEGGAE